MLKMEIEKVLNALSKIILLQKQVKNKESIKIKRINKNNLL
jgi:hypothetical protein